MATKETVSERDARTKCWVVRTGMKPGDGRYYVGTATWCIERKDARRYTTREEAAAFATASGDCRAVAVRRPRKSVDGAEAETKAERDARTMGFRMTTARGQAITPSGRNVVVVREPLYSEETARNTGGNIIRVLRKRLDLSMFRRALEDEKEKSTVLANTLRWAFDVFKSKRTPEEIATALALADEARRQGFVGKAHRNGTADPTFAAFVRAAEAGDKARAERAAEPLAGYTGTITKNGPGDFHIDLNPPAENPTKADHDVTKSPSLSAWEADGPSLSRPDCWTRWSTDKEWIVEVTKRGNGYRVHFHGDRSQQDTTHASLKAAQATADDEAVQRGYSLSEQQPNVSEILEPVAANVTKVAMKAAEFMKEPANLASSMQRLAVRIDSLLPVATSGDRAGVKAARRASFDARRGLFLDILRAGASEAGIRLAAQLLGFAPCPKCDFILAGCKCPKPDVSTVATNPVTQ